VTEWRIGRQRGQLAKLRDCGSSVNVCECFAKTLTDVKSRGVAAFDFTIFANGGNEVTLRAVREAEIVTRLQIRD
jgi:hypothetical protein